MLGSCMELMVRKNWFSDFQKICYACGGADGRLPTWSKGSSCRFRSGNFILKNCRHEDLHLCVCVWTTRLPGTWCEECCSLQVAMLWNNHIQTTLQTCWGTSFLEISAGRPWSMNEQRVAIRRAKNNRTGDDLGLVAEVLKHAPEDLRFADDLLVFATGRDDTIRLLEELVTSLGQFGLTLNTPKTKILTTQAQPGSSLQTSGGVTVEVLDSRCAHAWLGCMFQAAQGGNPSADLQHHLQAA